MGLSLSDWFPALRCVWHALSVHEGQDGGWGAPAPESAGDIR